MARRKKKKIPPKEVSIPKKPKEFVRPRYYPLTPDEILELGESIEDGLARAIFFTSYLTGARISEVARLRLAHIEKKDDFYEVRMVVLKKRRRRGMSRFVPIPSGKKAKCHEDRMMSHVIKYLSGSKKDYPFWVWGKPNDMNPAGRPDSVGEYLRRHCELRVEAQVKGKDGIWWEKIIVKPMHAHYLRHCRASHLAKYYNFDSLEITLYFSWEDPKMAMNYIEERSLKHAFG